MTINLLDEITINPENLITDTVEAWLLSSETRLKLIDSYICLKKFVGNNRGEIVYQLAIYLRRLVERELKDLAESGLAGQLVFTSLKNANFARIANKLVK